MNAIEAITNRSSIRAYLDKPVPKTMVESILETARWAPSGTNTQPWKVEVVTGATKQKITESLVAARMENVTQNPDYAYYPGNWREPYITRRKVCGLMLYKALGIGKDDADRKLKAWLANYDFFGAPVGLLFFIDKIMMGHGSFLDMGMFMQSVMIAATANGLATCPQASLADYPDIVRGILAMPDSLALVCGMALGYADMNAPVNQYRTEREPVMTFAKFHE